MLLIQKTDFTLFEEISAQIIKMYRIMMDNMEFDDSHIEIHAYIYDQGDGHGKQLWARGAILMPDRSKYSLTIDIIGSGIEALKVLRETVIKLFQEDHPEKYKKYLQSLN